MIKREVRSQKSEANGTRKDSLSSVLRPVTYSQFLIALLVLLALFVFRGGSHAQEGEGKGPVGPEITNIEIEDSVVKITVNGPIRYQIEKPADPFRIAVDLEGVRVGRFTDKITSQKEGVSEITPVQIEVPALASRLDILMQSPLDVTPEVKENTLILTLARPAGRAEKMRASESSEKTEARDEGLSLGEEESGSMVREIVEVFFEEDDNGLEFIIKGDGKLPDPVVSEVDGKMILYIPGVAMKAAVPSRAPFPVKDLRYRAEKDGVKFVIEIDPNVKKEVFLIEDELVIDMPYKDRKERRAEAQKKEEGLAKTSNNLVSLDFQDADVVAILRLLSDVSDFNIVVHPDVKGKITMKLNRVPWDQALDIILKTFNLGKAVEGNIIRIAPFAALARESDEVAKTKDSEMKAEALETRIFRLSYADAPLVEKTIKDSKILSPRGSVTFDKRTSSMVINDVPASFRHIENLLVTLDKPTPQVLIETRIVEVSTTMSKEIGIQWGITYKSSNTLVSAGGLSGVPRTGTGPVTGGNYLVDFPANVTPLSGSGITFGMLNAAKTLGLDAQLSAIEQIGNGRIISSPRVVTTDNEKAKILQGQSVPYAQRTSEGTVSAAFKDVAISIEVKPHITPANSIVLDVVTTKEDLIRLVDIGQGSQAPLTSKIEGNTKVLIENGETLVIGGIYKRIENTTNTGVPWLMNVPVLNWLFKKKVDQDDSTEVIIFITPRIVEKQ